MFISTYKFAAPTSRGTHQGFVFVQKCQFLHKVALSDAAQVSVLGFKLSSAVVLTEYHSFLSVDRREDHLL